MTAPYKYPRIVDFAERAAEDLERQDPALGAAGRRSWPTAPGRASRGSSSSPTSACSPSERPCAVLPHYVKDNLDGTDLEVGIVTGAFALTGIVCRPIAGNLADTRGRKPTVIGGALLAAIAGALYFVPAGIPGLIVARFFLGAGEGTVFTAGSAWNVDMAPVESRGRMIGLYGLAIWTGLTLGPPIGVLLQHAGGFHLVWAFAAGAPLLGAAIASRLPEQYRASEAAARGPFISREALGPGVTFALSVFGFAAVSAFIVLSLDARGIGHGPTVFSVFAATVVATRLVAGRAARPDRARPLRSRRGAGRDHRARAARRRAGPRRW